jgi:hypothetical protein
LNRPGSFNRKRALLDCLLETMSLKQLAGLPKNTLARPAPHTLLAETHDQRPIIKRILKKAGRPVMLL